MEFVDERKPNNIPSTANKTVAGKLDKSFIFLRYLSVMKIPKKKIIKIIKASGDNYPNF